jgi:hypothetical protein
MRFILALPIGLLADFGGIGGVIIERPVRRGCPARPAGVRGKISDVTGGCARGLAYRRRLPSGSPAGQRKFQISNLKFQIGS